MTRAVEGGPVITLTRERKVLEERAVPLTVP